MVSDGRCGMSERKLRGKWDGRFLRHRFATVGYVYPNGMWEVFHGSRVAFRTGKAATMEDAQLAAEDALDALGIPYDLCPEARAEVALTAAGVAYERASDDRARLHELCEIVGLDPAVGWDAAMAAVRDVAAEKMLAAEVSDG
jgi:hypothetical protein